MSQRNPMNERYTSDDRRGTTRKSAASAKPKSKAASSVTVVPGGKKPKTKEQIKAERREEDRKRREFNNRYYKPDTLRYKRLRIAWWVCLVLAIGCCALAFMGQDFLSGPAGVVVLVLTYVFLIAAFVIDLWPVRKERNAYQERMRQVELKREKAERAAAQQSQQKKGTAKKGSGKNQNRHAAQKAAPAAEEAPASDETPVKPARRGLFGSGFRLSNREKMQAEKKAAKEAKAAAKKESAE
ncbi:hypothetical protein GKZ27_09455 [Enterorhabdus mucosicola]|uniref:Uncharacterized protein n=1 Tax=Adlercreutzia mucosicola TaxID=580026 RepID=A0A6N8JPZ0_9ACTN|nr:hypothetical protein [Adlercreutzia mucosicola]MVX61672.1 hypothetical protein [Adlercreutzia mucosicola]